ncbi:hypothetical protein FACS189499_07490 [Clostridia bacterium]|nr:hypothetical protein FACS189499_07490 [Clostridia bacterium]
MPTLVEYFEILKRYEKQSKSDEARILRASLELYVTGSMNTFSHASNVDFTNRMVCFDIKDLGKNLKPLGMMIVLENLWEKLVENRLKGKRTRIYIDEIYLLFGSEESSNFLYELYKRARKWGGIPTGITQNVEDLLRSDMARSMLPTTEFVLMLCQNATDRQKFAEILKLSEESMQYVTQSPPGCGFMYAGKYGVQPFKDDFPRDAKLYQLMATRFGEAVQVK